MLKPSLAAASLRTYLPLLEPSLPTLFLGHMILNSLVAASSHLLHKVFSEIHCSYALNECPRGAQTLYQSCTQFVLIC